MIFPTAQFAVSCYALGTPAHSWQMVAQGKSAVAHKGMLKASEIFAAAAVELLNSPEVIRRAMEEFEERQDGQVYSCPIPPEIQPRRTRG